jgi:ribonuclease P protein component
MNADKRKDYRSGRTRRIRRQADLDAVFRQGRRLSDARITLLARPNGLEFSRIGVAVSTDHGCAVRRNRIKRLCREALRLARPELPSGWDFLVVPRRGGELALAALRESVVRLAGRLAARPSAEEQ